MKKIRVTQNTPRTKSFQKLKASKSCWLSIDTHRFKFRGSALLSQPQFGGQKSDRSTKIQRGKHSGVILKTKSPTEPEKLLNCRAKVSSQVVIVVVLYLRRREAIKLIYADGLWWRASGSRPSLVRVLSGVYTYNIYICILWPPPGTALLKRLIKNIRWEGGEAKSHYWAAFSPPPPTRPTPLVLIKSRLYLTLDFSHCSSSPL